MEKNLTTGSVFKTLLAFSLPYLFSYFLQTLYGMADLFIIGQFDPVAHITAVSIGSQVMHMLTVMIVGLAMGSTVMIAQSVGAGQKERASLTTGNTITLFMIASVLLTILLLFLIRPIVTVMSTPVEAVPGTITYLTICFLGIPCITAYNVISSIFRGMGDSKSPMYFIAIACVSNIILDYLFIGFFHFGPAGAALGTTVSQAISVLAALISLYIHPTGLSVSLHDLRPRRNIMGQILKIGIPVAMQDGLTQVAFIIITIIANRRGLNTAAAVGIVEKVISFFFLVPSSTLSAVSALGAQNIGAGKYNRATQTLRYAIYIAAGFGLTVSVLIQGIAPFVVALFTSDQAVIHLGTQYLRGYILDCFFAGIHFCFSGYFCASGKSGYSFLHNIASITLARIPGVYLTSIWFPDTLFPMGLATVSGSILSCCICLFLFFRLHATQKAQEQFIGS